MIKTFKYTTDSEDTYGVSQLGLKKGDIFQLIDQRLSFIEKSCATHSLYHYEFLINIPNDGCYPLNEEMWRELIICSEYVDSE